MKKISSIEDQYIGSRLKFRRSLLGVSQTQLGKFEKLTFQQVQKYESGVNKISSGRLCRFGKFLHVPPSYFFDGIEEFIDANGGDKVAQLKLDSTKMDASIHSDLRKLNQLFLKIKCHKLRNAVIALAKSLVGVSGE